MGAVPSLRLRNSCITESKMNSPTRSFITCASSSRRLPGDINDYPSMIPYNGSDLRIDDTLMRTCEAAWKCVVTNNGCYNRNENWGLFAFCDRFFYHMEILDHDHIALPNFKPRSTSRCPSRTALLLKVIKYMLSLPNDKFSSKSKIRRLGRAHATRGIREPHFKIFAESFMRSFCEVLGSEMKPNMARSWSILLAFFVRELSFENVTFRPHNFYAQGQDIDDLSLEGASLINNNDNNSNHDSDVDGGKSFFISVSDKGDVSAGVEAAFFCVKGPEPAAAVAAAAMNRSVSAPNLASSRLELFGSSNRVVDDFNCSVIGGVMEAENEDAIVNDIVGSVKDPDSSGLN